MTWVKVCGIREPKALEAAIEAGADAIGLNIAPESPRCIDLPTTAALAAMSPMPTFLVSVGLDVEAALAAMDATGVGGIQPHGRHSLDVAAAALDLGKNVLVPIPVGADGPTVPMSEVPEGAVPLFDTKSVAAHGGTGRTFDWDVIGGIDHEFVLAGGLGVDNVAEAIRTVRPFGVDASSRLERVPGVKDPDTIRAFVREAKQA